VINAGYLIKHDEDKIESGVYAVINKKIDPANHMHYKRALKQSFLPENKTNKFATIFEKQSGYNPWH
jgi:hypothetical protein